MNTFLAFSEGVSVLAASVADDVNVTIPTVVAGVVDANNEAVVVVNVVISVAVVDGILLVDDDDVNIFDVVVVAADGVTFVVSVSCVATAVSFDA